MALVYTTVYMLLELQFHSSSDCHHRVRQGIQFLQELIKLILYSTSISLDLRLL